MNKNLQVIKYILSDYLSAVLAWSLFYLYRKFFIEPDKFGILPEQIFDRQFVSIFISSKPLVFRLKRNLLAISLSHSITTWFLPLLRIV